MLQIRLHTYSSFKYNVLFSHSLSLSLSLSLSIVTQNATAHISSVLQSIYIFSSNINSRHYFSDKRFPNAKFLKATVEHFYSALMRSKRQKKYFMQLVINVCVRVTYGDMCIGVENIILLYVHYTIQKQRGHPTNQYWRQNQYSEA